MELNEDLKALLERDGISQEEFEQDFSQYMRTFDHANNFYDDISPDNYIDRKTNLVDMMSEVADTQAKYADPSYNSLLEDMAKSQGYDTTAITSKFLNDREQFTDNLDLNPDLKAQYDALSAEDNLLNERVHNEVMTKINYAESLSEEYGQQNKNAIEDEISGLNESADNSDNSINQLRSLYNDAETLTYNNDIDSSSLDSINSQIEIYEEFIDKYESTIYEYSLQLDQNGGLDKASSRTEARELIDRELGIPERIFYDKGAHYLALVAAKVEIIANQAYNAGDEMEDLQKSEIYEEAHSILTGFKTLPIQLPEGRDTNAEQKEYIENLSGYSEDFLYNSSQALHPDFNIENDSGVEKIKSKHEDTYNSFSDQLDFSDEAPEGKLIKPDSVAMINIQESFAMSANPQTVLQQEAEMTFAQPKGLNA